MPIYLVSFLLKFKTSIIGSGTSGASSLDFGSRREQANAYIHLYWLQLFIHISWCQNQYEVELLHFGQ